jgi:16S rRNA (guanine966-N2)-methyltransferase
MNKKTHPLVRAGQLRIIGGQWRGRKLPILDSTGLRPTTDRVRETLFNWLQNTLPDSRCLDCFAGSGALGFEALSRYATVACLVELDRHVVKQLQANQQKLAASGCNIVQADTIQWLSKTGTAYDVVFVDPPFHQGLTEKTIELLERNGWLAERAFIYVERETNAPELSVPDSWSLYREKVAGQVCSRLYYRNLTEN